LSESFKFCPICETHNHRNAAICITCGTSLNDLVLTTKQNGKTQQHDSYDYRYGETDLFEGSVASVGRVFTVGVFILGILIGVGIAIAVLAPSFNETQAIVVADTPTASPTLRLLPTVTAGVATATQSQTPTITFTPTETHTPEPCTQTVVAGDTLIGVIFRCGHITRDIIPTVVSLNGIADETRIQIGQQIVVPWPTSSPDPNALPTNTPESSANASGESSLSNEVALLSFDPFAPTATSTLLPGVMWHTVQPNTNMIVIASQYGANAKVLSDLNPEIDFARCDFGEAYGGPECIVQLSQGQQIRVPAPTPTLTIEPTSSGSETPTPQPTLTFNVPSAINPANQAFFGEFDQVTLRWVTTGTVGENEVYRVAVSDVTSGETYTADTYDLFLILPSEWQATDDQRHNYIWQMSVYNTDTNTPSYSTQTRTFVWQGTGEDNS
jgi:hypothetical protein